jgi:hypothetical protein
MLKNDIRVRFNVTKQQDQMKSIIAENKKRRSQVMKERNEKRSPAKPTVTQERFANEI